MRNKIIICFTSIILSLFFVEVGLRVTGKFLLAKKSKKETFKAPTLNLYKSGYEKEEIRVLTLGDSVTFGGWGVAEKSYPSYLNDFLSTVKGKKYKVINNGMRGNTSRSILNQLKSYLEFHKPDIVVLLVGAANRYRFYEYDLNKNDPNSDDLKKDDLNFFYSLRVVKAFKFIIRELSRKPIIKNVFHNQKYANVEKMWIEFSPLSDEVLKKLRVEYLAKKNLYSSIEDLIRLSHIELNLEELERSRELLLKAFKLDPNSNDIRTNLAFLYTSFAAAEKNPKQILKYFIKAVGIAPDNTYLNSIFKPFITNYELQSVINPQEIIQVLEQRITNEPFLKNNKVFMGYVWYFKNSANITEKIGKWIESDLEKIVNITREANIKMIIQNYHVPYSVANKYLEKVAKKYHIPLVDNTASFRKVIKNERDRQRYVKDDDHCTNEGHEIIAKNVFKAILKL